MSWLSSLFRREKTPSLWTGKVLTAQEFKQLLGAWEATADDTYAEINADALPAYYEWFKKKLFDLGLPQWDEKADCDDFTNFYADFLQLRFYLAQWEPGTLPAAQGAAVARYWYRPKANGGAGHAINAVATNRGLLFIEPQTGRILTLNSDEVISRLRIYF